MALASKWLERRRLAMALPYVNPPVLDIGCARCPAFVATPDGYVGIDIDKKTLREEARAGGRVLLASAAELPFTPGSFRTVLMTAVIEHLPDAHASLSEALRVLQPGGRIVLTTPTPIGDKLHHVLARIGLTSKHAAAEHQSLFSGEALRRLVIDAGCELDIHKYFLFGGNQVCVGRVPGEGDPLEQAA